MLPICSPPRTSFRRGTRRSSSAWTAPGNTAGPACSPSLWQIPRWSYSEVPWTFNNKRQSESTNVCLWFQRIIWRKPRFALPSSEDRKKKQCFATTDKLEFWMKRITTEAYSSKEYIVLIPPESELLPKELYKLLLLRTLDNNWLSIFNNNYLELLHETYMHSSLKTCAWLTFPFWNSLTRNSAVFCPALFSNICWHLDLLVVHRYIVL